MPAGTLHRRLCQKILGGEFHPKLTQSKTRERRSISKMNGLSKDSVSFLEIDESGESQRIDNFLFKHLKGVPKSHVYRILRGGRCG